MILMWGVLALIVLLLLVSIVVAKKRGGEPTDYYTLFVIGITWLPFGIIVKIMDSELFIGNLFIFLGFVYSVIGLAHRSEWKKNHKGWRDLKDKDKRIKIIISLVLGLVLLIGLTVFYFFVKV